MNMRIRSINALLLSLACLSAPLAGQTVGVTAYQEGKDKEQAPEAFLIALGSGCMDELFYSGYVATSNKPSIATAAEFRDGKVLDLASAREAFVAYEIMLLVSVGKSSYSKSLKIPLGAEYRVVEVKSGKILVQGALGGAEDAQDPQKAIDAWCASASKTIMPVCLRTIVERSEKVGS